MKTRVAINGFGRIGRNVFKVLIERDDVEVVAINDLTDNATLAHLLRFDTAYGQYAAEIEVEEGALLVAGNRITMVSEPDPEKLPWADHGIDVVVESTGRFTSPTAAQAHVRAGAKSVVISAPAKGEGAEDAVSVIIGVNDHQQLDQDLHGKVVTNASCTTNCTSPVASVLESSFGIEMALMSTIHSYTASQNLQDGPHKNLRSARAAAENIIPASTGAAIATTRIIPELENKFDGLAIRVPSVTVSLIDMVAVLRRDVSVDEVNQAFIDAANQPYFQGILTVTDLPVVSSDIRGDSHSAVVDLDLTRVVGGRMVKVMAWYDNEWGYSNRLAELVADVGSNLQKSSAANAPSANDVSEPDSLKTPTPGSVVIEPDTGMGDTVAAAAVEKPPAIISDMRSPVSVEDEIASDSQLLEVTEPTSDMQDPAESIIGFGDDGVNPVDAAQQQVATNPVDSAEVANNSDVAEESLPSDEIAGSSVNMDEVLSHHVPDSIMGESTNPATSDSILVEDALVAAEDEVADTNPIMPGENDESSAANVNSSLNPGSSVAPSGDVTPPAESNMGDLGEAIDQGASANLLDDIAADMEEVRESEPDPTTTPAPSYSDIVKPHKKAPMPIEQPDSDSTTSQPEG